VVEHPTSPALFLSHSESGGFNGDNIRCISKRLGRSLSREGNMRVVVDRGSLFPYQSARIEGSLPGPSMFPEGDSVNTCLNEAGQSDSHSILESNGEPSYFPLFQLVIDIWNWYFACQITLHTEYLPGTENTRTDWESRHHHDAATGNYACQYSRH